MGTILELQNITKRYPGVVALNNMSISFSEGEIHAIMGENGAGKSTMIKVITGAISAEEGRVIIGGQTFEKLTPLLSKEHGIGVIYQEFNLISSLSVAENMFLGDKTGNALMPDFSYMRKRAKEIMDEFDFDSRTSFRRKYLTPMLKNRVLKMTIPEKPSSKNQKYFS